MKYIDAEKLKKIVKQAKQRALKGVEVDDDLYCDGRADAFGEVLLEIDSLQQEQPEVDLEKEIDAIWNPRFNLGWDEKSLLSINRSAFETIARHFYDLRNRALEEAARHVYESWMGGTMDDVRRDMVELGKVLNARKK